MLPLKISNLKGKLFALCAVFLGAVILWLFKVPCIFKTILGIACPGCGMTRAVISLFKFDFAAAFSFHPMFWSLPVLVLYFLADGKVFKNKIINITVILLIGAGFLINWIFKLI